MSGGIAIAFGFWCLFWAAATCPPIKDWPEQRWVIATAFGLLGAAAVSVGLVL